MPTLVILSDLLTALSLLDPPLVRKPLKKDFLEMPLSTPETILPVDDPLFWGSFSFPMGFYKLGFIFRNSDELTWCEGKEILPVIEF